MRDRRRDEDGAVAVLAALVFLTLFTVAAMVVQFGFSRDVRSESQNASDASALAAASVLANSPSAPNFVLAVQIAQSYAATNFHLQPPETWTQAWARCTDPQSLAYVPTGSTKCISFDRAVAPTLVRVVMPSLETRTDVGAGAGVRQLPIGSSAEASVTATGGGDCGFCVLANTSVSGNPGLSVSNADVHLNGAPAFSGNPSVTVTNGRFTTESSPRTSGRPNFSPAPVQTGRLEDPFSALALPFSTSSLPNAGNVNKSGNASTACNLQPGRYGSINLSGQVECVLAEGVYAITGQLSMSGQSGIDATSGVTLYFTCGTSASPHECKPGNSGGSLDVSGNNTFQINAPSRGATQGLAIVYDLNNEAALNYSGNNQDRLIGSVYAKSATLNLSGTADTDNTDSMIVVKNLILSGNGTIRISYTQANNAPTSKPEIHLSR